MESYLHRTLERLLTPLSVFQRPVDLYDVTEKLLWIFIPCGNNCFNLRNVNSPLHSTNSRIDPNFGDSSTTE